MAGSQKPQRIRGQFDMTWERNKKLLWDWPPLKLVSVIDVKIAALLSKHIFTVCLVLFFFFFFFCLFFFLLYFSLSALKKPRTNYFLSFIFRPEELTTV